MGGEQNTRFQINEYIFHGGSGVCVVEDICIPQHMRTRDPSREYYRLHPIYETNSVIYTPVDSSMGIVRRILTKAEATELIRQIPFIETIDVENEKMREEQFRSALRTNNCYEWIRVIKTLYLRSEQRKQEGKRPWQSDEKYLQLAENLLYGELAVPLGIPKEQVQEYIMEKVQPVTERAQSPS